MYIDKTGEKHHPNDQEFITQIYQEFNRLMYFTARKYNSDPHQCEDVVQDSLRKLIEKVDTLRQLNRFTLASYIVVTVRHTAIDHLKQQGDETNWILSLDDMSENISQDPTSTLDDGIIRKERLEEVRRIWPLLDAETRQIVEGKYILEYDDKQLAELLGCQPSSVRMKLTRARRKAMEFLKEGAKQ